MDRRIELVISKIKSETAVAWNTPAFAALVNLSPSRFRHLFKQETGTSPAQYLKAFRMRRAAAMLRTTFLSVKQVLKQVGITSNTHFVRDFKNIYGLTPTAYRRTISRTSKARKRRKKKKH
jgi:AraC family transcriptional regulator, arabinose operon regulatory protein